MTERTLLNPDRPPIFCPGCSHDKVLRVLDRSFIHMGLKADEICMVSDIGCSGFFDVFFNTHAFHGLHGRALTYAAGIKLCRPDLNVVVTMGDGGLGIGGAHVIQACRRNLDLTLLVLNNFNFGMTGGQCSATTPTEADVASGFLNKLDKPLNPVSLAAAAGAPFVCRCSAYQDDLSEILEQAVRFKGFSLVEILGICPGRYSKRNRLTRQSIADELAVDGTPCGEIPANRRPEFGEAYRRHASAQLEAQPPKGIEARFTPPQPFRQGVVFLGAAGQHIITAGEILALAGMTAGMYASQKNEYNVTVLRGPSISEMILSPGPIDYNGSASPDVVIALATEGVRQRTALLTGLSRHALVLSAPGVDLPSTAAQVLEIDFKAMGIQTADRALASLGVLAKMERVLSVEMLQAALELRFQGNRLQAAREMLHHTTA